MGTPFSIEILNSNISENLFDQVFGYLMYVDQKFSTYKDNSEITLINKGKLKLENFSSDMKLILKLSNLTKRETNGYFDINHKGILDPSGIVKGWAIYNACRILLQKGVNNFYIEAGGDIQAYGKNNNGQPWQIGIRNPFDNQKIIKRIVVENLGVATSGTYLRGQHIYNPKNKNRTVNDLVSLTVVGPNIYEADRFATAAFAMGQDGVFFLEKLPGFEGYAVAKNGIGTFTSGFNRYVV
jgi:thiamine biosynthesis lipoprotein